MILWMYVDENGRVGTTTVKASSGHPELDAAAERVATSMSFTPALNRGSATDVWVSQTITFEPSLTAQDVLAYGDRPPEERPLVVIDGVIQTDPLSEAASSLDIGRREIIKGEAARALYGERGRNGVIQITTK